MTARTISVDPETSTREDRRNFVLLATLDYLKNTGGHCWGPTVENLHEASGLKDDDFNKALSWLVSQKGLVRYRYSQEGTAGPFAHRYQLLKSVAFSAAWEEND